MRRSVGRLSGFFFGGSVLPSRFDATKNGRDMNSGRVLVTGATGRLGANLIRRLLADGEEIRVPIRRGLDSESPGEPRCEASLRRSSGCRGGRRGCSRICHRATLVSTKDGKSSIPRSSARVVYRMPPPALEWTSHTISSRPDEASTFIRPVLPISIRFRGKRYGSNVSEISAIKDEASRHQVQMAAAVFE